MPDGLTDIRRRQNSLAALVVAMIIINVASTLGLVCCAWLMALHVRTSTREETIADIRSEFYAPLISELRTLAGSTTDEPDPRLD